MIAAETFLPGLCIERGGLVYASAKLEHPGDLLHEAGHIAMSPPSKRDVMGGTLDEELGVQLEMAAIAWSYAACSFLKLDPKRGFPRDGIQRR